MKPSASLLFWAALLFTSCTQKHDNCAVYGQFALEENFGNEESKPDTTVFSSLTLGPEWLFPNGPVRGMTYVDERPETIVHGISLPCVNMSSKQNGEIPCQMARRIRSEHFAVMVEMFFEPKDGDAAGLIVSTGNSSSSQISKGLRSQLFFYRDLAGLSLRRMNHQGFDLLAETELPDFVTRIYLRIERSGPHFSFFYRYEGSGPDDWTQVGDSIYIASDTSCAGDATLIGLCTEHSASL
jgi:hypothetical protein